MARARAPWVPGNWRGTISSTESGVLHLSGVSTGIQLIVDASEAPQVSGGAVSMFTVNIYSVWFDQRILESTNSLFRVADATPVAGTSIVGPMSVHGFLVLAWDVTVQQFAPQGQQLGPVKIAAVAHGREAL
jgi:hypothetical protein